MASCSRPLCILPMTTQWPINTHAKTLSCACEGLLIDLLEVRHSHGKDGTFVYCMSSSIVLTTAWWLLWMKHNSYDPCSIFSWGWSHKEPQVWPTKSTGDSIIALVYWLLWLPCTYSLQRKKICPYYQPWDWISPWNWCLYTSSQIGIWISGKIQNTIVEG